MIGSRHAVLTFVVCLALVALTLLRAGDAAMRRPFEVDELLTVDYYTWVGVSDEGEVRQLHHIEEFYATPRPSLKNLAIGIYCSAGRWPEPNNHIVNSLLVGASLVAQRSERAARMPALAATAVFAFALYWLCGPVLGWRLAGPMAVVWAWFCPYVVEYGFRARGYALMLALQVLLLIALRWLALKPRSILRGSVCALVAILSMLNIVNMTVDWLLPVYASLLLFPPPDMPGGERHAWRRSLIVQGLAVASVGAVFLVSHLPAVYSASQQYGLAFDSASRFVDVVGEAGSYLFPGIIWKIFGGLSIAGIALMFAASRTRWLASIVLFTLGISLVHFLAAGKLPFERGVAYVLPLTMLGVACLVDWSVERMGRAPALIAGAALAAFIILPSRQIDLTDFRVARSLEMARQLQPSSGVPTVMLFENSFDYVTTMYRPRTWQYVPKPLPARELQIVGFVPRTDEFGDHVIVAGGPAGASLWRVDAWKYRHYRSDAHVGLLQMLGEARAFPDAGFDAEQPRSLIFWYPDPSRLGVRGDDQRRLAASSRLRHFILYGRYTAKLDVFLNLQAIVFIAESSDEYRRANLAVRDAIERLGGAGLIFKPAPERSEVS